MDKFNKYVETLYSLINNKTPAIVLSGISGLGKSNIIRCVGLKFPNAIWLDYDFALYEGSFKENLFYSLKKEIDKKRVNVASININHGLEDQIFFLLKEIEKESRVVLSFENIEEAKSGDLAFISKLCCFNSDFFSLSIIVVDNIDRGERKNFSQLQSRILFSPINVERYTVSDIEQYICEIMHCSEITAPANTLQHIYETAQGTLSAVNIILNELNTRNLAQISNGKYTISSLPKNFLIQGIEPFIHDRFNRLEPEYKTLLAKTSCIGMVFNGEDVFNIFSIAHIYDLLLCIQDASHLILCIEKNEYKFESAEVYKFIQKNVNGYCDKPATIKTCADYYRMTLTESLKTSNHNKYMRNLLLAKELYEAVNDTQNLLACFRLLIGWKMELGLYREAKKLCDIYCEYCTDSSLSYFNDLQKLECLIELEEYDEVQPLIEKLRDSSISFPNYINYYSALAYYGTSNGKQALEILFQDIKIIDEDKAALLFAKELRLISSVSDFYDDWDNQIYYFNHALNVCKKHQLKHEYYSLLRQSGMIYAPEIAMKHYQDSEKYFMQCGDVKECAKVAHNIATDALYMLNVTLSSAKCEESINLFSSIGSQNISNPLNLKGILLCIENKKYSDAIHYFLKSADYHFDKFMKCVAYLNSSTSYLKMGKINEYKRYIQLTKDLNAESMPIISINTRICELLFLYQFGNIDDCKTAINGLLKLKDYLEYRHIYVIRYIINALSLEKDYSFIIPNSDTKTNYINSNCAKYLDRCLNDGCYWATTRFWEN